MTGTGDPSASYPLEGALDFLRRLWQLNHALERVSSRMERRLGVTAQQRLILRCVGKYPGVTVGHLASLLHVDPGTVSASLNRLERKGLLERRLDPRDKRRVSLGLTSSGHALDHPTEGTVEAAAERLLGSVHPDEIETMVRVVARLTVLLDEESQPTNAVVAREASRAR